MANTPSSKKTYTIHITYTTNSPTSELKTQQSNASPAFSKTNAYSNQDKQWQNQYGYKNSGKFTPALIINKKSMVLNAAGLSTLLL